MSLLIQDNLEYDSTLLTFAKPLTIKNDSAQTICIKIKMNTKTCLSLSTVQEKIKPSATCLVQLKIIQKPSIELKLQINYLIEGTSQNKQKIVTLKPIISKPKFQKNSSDPLITSLIIQKNVLYSSQNNLKQNISSMKNIKLEENSPNRFEQEYTNFEINEGKQSLIQIIKQKQSLNNQIKKEKQINIQLQSIKKIKQFQSMMNIKQIVVVMMFGLFLGTIVSSLLQPYTY